MSKNDKKEAVSKALLRQPLFAQGHQKYTVIEHYLQ
jgi:hypothetical protein